MALKAVLDTSIRVPLFTADALNVRAFAILENSDASFIVSDFAALEFASACAFKIRVGSLTAAEATMAREALVDAQFRLA